ncbi:hypothetical protein [Haladaptatus sp. NG-WS-4]
MDSQTLKKSAVAGFISLIITLVITYIASLIFPTPWEVFIAVGLASFFSAFGGAYGAHMQYRD